MQGKQSAACDLLRLLPFLVCAGACGTSDFPQTQGQRVAGWIPSGSEAEINAVLVGGGAEAILCPQAIFTLSNPVIFTAPDQRLYTQAFPTDETRALLRIGVGTLTKAIDGNSQS